MAEPKRVMKIVVMHLVIVPVLFFGLKSYFTASGSWAGVDEAVVEKIAREHGREAKAPLIDPGSGDLLLFAFLLAGSAGGFAAGYFWRELVKKR
jgi:cobalt/nickel transport protein